MTIEVYSHNKGQEIISEKLAKQVLHSIESIHFPIRKSCADHLRVVILDALKKQGWSNVFRLDVHSQISLTSSYDNHILCLQTGNMSRFYADLLKLQYVFINGKGHAAFYLIPSKSAAKEMGSNIAHFDRFVSELKLFRDIITIPILVVGIK